jgi:hypothetical protein
MKVCASTGASEAPAAAFYCDAMRVLKEAGVEFLVGGAYAFERYTGIARDTKDFDVFVRYLERDRALDALAAAGYRTEMTFPHWLGKAYGGELFVDLIFSSGNGVATVDDAWFAHARPGCVLGMPVLLSPPEEMIWSKAFIMERERFDGADVTHLIHAVAEDIDWQRLVARFGRHWRVLLTHLILFGFVYPSERARVPAAVMEYLLHRLQNELSSPSPERVCQGTILSRAQYLLDLQRAGYADARLAPRGALTPDEVALWTAAIEW